MDTVIEKDCVIMEEFFQQIVIDMKSSFPIWEDFISKAGRLHVALKTTAACTTSFLESFQKLADMAAGTRGSTREIGSALTRLCMRHRSIDSKLKTFTGAIMDAMVNPLQERMDDWKKSVVVLDREHAKENKKAHQELRRAVAELARLQKKAQKGKSDVGCQLEQATHEANDRLTALHSLEKQSLRNALIEERSRLCLFVTGLKPVMDEELSIMTELSHVQEIVHSLCMLINDPESLPVSTENLIADMLKSGPGAAASIVPQSVESHTSATSERDSGANQSPNYANSYQRSFSMPTHTSSSNSGGNADVQPIQMQQLVTEVELRKKHISETDSLAQNNAAEVIPKGLARSALILSSSTADQRPHTISSSYERFGSSRPSLTADMFTPLPSSVQNRPPSLHGTIGTSSSAATASPYAVPCIVPPKRRDTNVQSGTKVADIYARPSLIGVRGGSARVLPVATPTVPDMPGEVQSPPSSSATNMSGIPLAGYVNMNQLAHMALEHQGLGHYEKKDGGEVIWTYMGLQGKNFGNESDAAITGFAHPNRSSVVLGHSGTSLEYRNDPNSRSSVAEPAHYATLPAGAYASSRPAEAETYDSRMLAARLELACRLLPVSGYATLPRRPRDNTKAFKGHSSPLYSHSVDVPETGSGHCGQSVVSSSDTCSLPQHLSTSARNGTHMSLSSSDIAAMYTNKKTSTTETSGHYAAPQSRAFSVTGVPSSGIMARVTAVRDTERYGAAAAVAAAHQWSSNPAGHATKNAERSDQCFVDDVDSPVL